jgi:hypothetical protein
MTADQFREITEEEIRRYEEDGVVLLKGMFDQTWLKRLSEQIEGRHRTSGASPR